jgi:D-methionine transport system ATP-binding protein
VFDNVAFPLKIHTHLSKHEIRERVEECLNIVGLTNKANSYPAQLSGGQATRCNRTRAGEQTASAVVR